MRYEEMRDTYREYYVRLKPYIRELFSHRAGWFEGRQKLFA